MGNLANGIMPFTETVERMAKLVREDSLNVEAKLKGLVNDVYTKHIPRKFDWRPLMRSSYIQCTAYYSAGTVSIEAASTSIVGVGTVWTSGMTAANGWKIKFSNNPNIYTFTYVSGTTATLSPALSGASDLASVSYKIFRDTYSLASDFDRFLINGGLEYTRGGTPDVIRDTAEDAWKYEFQTEPQDNICRMRLLGVEDSDGYKQVQVNPPPRTPIMLPYDYIKTVRSMTEYTTGSITTLANGGTAVTGTGTDFDGYGISGYTYYLRIDGDGEADESVWYKIASFDSGTGITLATAYNGVALSSATASYTISMVPELPAKFHDAILYMAIQLALADQADPIYKFYTAQGNTVLAELKTIYKTRTYNKTPEVVIDRR